MKYTDRPKSENVENRSSSKKISNKRRYFKEDAPVGGYVDPKEYFYKDDTGHAVPITEAERQMRLKTGSAKLQNEEKGAEYKAPFNQMPRERPKPKIKYIDAPTPLPRWKTRGPIKLK
ncbi:MAG: hypothetical protein KKH61_21415 [Gammaproteobacteria bacterium]|uniref:Uncharacterized protein n=1 Tax=viral metagenome TaxID=1070528 RepID=A0A6H1ZAQ0_9ZZZZ|nr:hypothetical protein [Gammaproteobacteria bacterium]